MSASKTIRLQESTLQKLGKIAEPFESPNDCIERLLSQRSCANVNDSKISEESDENEN